MAIPERSEDVRYWAFGVLIAAASASEALEASSPSTSPHGSAEGQRRSSDVVYGREGVARVAVQSMEKRMRGAIKGYVDDARLRGQMPLGR